MLQGKKPIPTKGKELRESCLHGFTNDFLQKKCSRLYCFLIILTHFIFVSETIFGIKNPDRLTPLPVGPQHFSILTIRFMFLHRLGSVMPDHSMLNLIISTSIF